MGKEYIHWNIRGLSDKVRRKGKVDRIISLLQNPKELILINLQETHLLTSNDIPYKLSEFKHVFHIVSSFASISDKGSGILMLINKSEIIMSQMELLKGRFLILVLKNQSTNK